MNQITESFIQGKYILGVLLTFLFDTVDHDTVYSKPYKHASEYLTRKIKGTWNSIWKPGMV